MLRWPTRAKYNSILSWIQNNFTRCTTIFRDAKQFLHGAQQFFVIQNNSTRCTTIFRDAKQFFTVHNNFSRFKTIFHGAQQAFEIQNNFHSAQQAFEIQNKFSWCTTCFRDAVDAYVEHNSVSRRKIKFHDAQQKFERLVTSTDNFISRDHTTACSLPPCFVNTRATQLTMAASLLPTGDEKEIITYYFSRGCEYDAIVHFLAKFPDITMSIRTLKNGLQRYQLLYLESLLCTVKIVLYLESLLCTVKNCFESRKIVVHREKLFCITKNCCAPCRIVLYHEILLCTV